MEVLRLLGRIEYIALRGFLRFTLGKNRRNKQFNDGIINIKNIMVRHFIDGRLGFFKPINKEEFVTVYDGFKQIVPLVNISRKIQDKIK